MKKLTKDIWIKIALSLLGVLAATFVYVPNYALVDQGLKGRCAIFFIIAIVFTVTRFIDNIYIRLLVAFILIFPVFAGIYHLVATFYKKESE